jgi:hypothetical protein
MRPSFEAFARDSVRFSEKRHSQARFFSVRFTFSRFSSARFPALRFSGPSVPRAFARINPE